MAFKPPTSSKKYSNTFPYHLEGVLGVNVFLLSLDRCLVNGHIHLLFNWWPALGGGNHASGRSSNMMLQCLCILSRCFKNNSLVSINSSLSLFTRATKHFLPCWRPPKHTNALRLWRRDTDLCITIPATKTFFKAHRDDHTTAPFSKSAVNKTACVFTFTECHSLFWIVWVFLFGLFLVFFCLMRKKTIHRQSWSKLRQLLQSPGICVYLNQRQQLKCCRTAWCLCCTPSTKRSSLGFWTVLITELSGWQLSSEYVSMHVHESALTTPFLFFHEPSHYLVLVFREEFIILLSIQTCAFSFIVWMSQALYFK